MYLIRYKKNISTPIIDKIKVDEILKPSDMFLFKIKNNTINEEIIEQHTRLKLKNS